MKKYVIVFTLVAGIFIIGCKTNTSPIEQMDRKTIRPLTQSEQLIIESDQIFGLKLFKEVVRAQADTNIFISPLSVSMALGMTLNGASGDTYEAMRQTLELNRLSEEEINSAYQSLIKLLTTIDKEVLFEIANSIWYRNTFSVEETFMDVNHTYFDAEVAGLDFDDPATVDVINGWIADKTHDKITEVLDQIDPMVVMYLINAIYFKAAWQYEFDKEATEEETFYITNENSVNCQMMKITANLGYYQDEQVRIVNLPYGDSTFSMTIFRPEASADINEFVESLNGTQWQYYLDNLQTKNGTVELPKFKLEYKLLMNDVLTNLGMGVAFSYDADFTRINSNGGLFISRVIHKTFVQVDEEGTEAAAVTVVEVGFTSEGPHVDFCLRMDRPFIFVIHERQSGAILFMGKIIQPEWTD